MIHHVPETVGWIGTSVSTSVAFVAAQTGSGDLPNWLNGTIAGGMILLLIYLLKFVIGLWQSKDSEIREMNENRIKQLETEVEDLKERLRRERSKQ